MSDFLLSIETAQKNHPIASITWNVPLGRHQSTHLFLFSPAVTADTVKYLCFVYTVNVALFAVQSYWLSNDFLCFGWAGTATVPRSKEQVEKQIKAYFWNAQQTLRPNTINLCQFDLPTDFQWATAIANQFHNIFWNFPAHFIACYYYSCCCCCCCSCCCYCCCWCCDYWCVKIQSLCGCCCFDYSDGCCNLCFLSLFSYRVLYLEYVFCIHYNMGTCNKSYSLPWREFNWILNKIELIISLLSALLTSSVSLANELVCKVYLTCVVHKLQLSCRS